MSKKKTIKDNKNTKTSGNKKTVKHTDAFSQDQENTVMQKDLKKEEKTEEVEKNNSQESSSVGDSKETIPVSIESTNEIKEKKKATLPIMAISIIIFVVVSLVFILPWTKLNKARQYISENKNEEAINETIGVVPLFGLNETATEAKNAIALEIAKTIQNEDIKFSNKYLEIKSITDCIVDLYDAYEEVQFTVDYANDNCFAIARCIADKLYKEDGWKLNSYDILSVEYYVNEECDQTIPDEMIYSLYSNAEFIEKEEKQQLSQTFVYSYKEMNKTDPFYYDVYRIDAVCAYSIADNKWSVADMNTTIVSTEEIPFKEFITSTFRIYLPETWIMSMYEQSSSYEHDGTIDKSYYYTYHWFANKENMFSYNERDGGADLLSIYLNYGDNQIDNSSRKGTTVNSSSLGKGYSDEWSYNGHHWISMSFSPRINGYRSTLSVQSGNADDEKMIDIIDGIIIKNNTYYLEVLVNKLNIRPYASTYQSPVGSTSRGKKYKATEACDSDGYRWYKIGEGQWIADLDGEYLKVTYN